MNIKILPASTAIVFSLFINTGFAADSSCKGLAEKSCSNESSCRWVDPYKRTDGREVKGYCRALPAKSADAKVSGLDAKS